MVSEEEIQWPELGRAKVRQLSRIGTDDAEDEHTESSEDELYWYLNMKPKRLECNGDPLLWWRKHETDFPRLASVACDVLAIPGMLLLIIKLGLSH